MVTMPVSWAWPMRRTLLKPIAFLVLKIVRTVIRGLFTVINIRLIQFGISFPKCFHPIRYGIHKRSSTSFGFHSEHFPDQNNYCPAVAQVTVIFFLSQRYS